MADPSWHSGDHQLGKVKAQLRERAELDEDQLGCPWEVSKSGWWFQTFLFSPLFGEDFHFD